MKWFAAHIVMAFEFKDVEKEFCRIGDIFAWENVVVFLGNDPADVFAKARAKGKSEEGDEDGTLTWQDRPVTRRFAGVRKVVECEILGQEGVLEEGCEITYSEILIRDALDGTLDKLLGGDPVEVEIVYD